MQAFSIFHLSTVSVNPAHAEAVDECLQRLAGFGEVPYSELHSQYHTHFDGAEHIHDAEHMDSINAWKHQINRAGHRKLIKLSRWQVNVLATILCHDAACLPTTSGLEQAFAQVERLFGPRHCLLNPQREWAILDLVTDNNPHEEVADHWNDLHRCIDMNNVMNDLFEINNIRMTCIDMNNSVISII